MIIKIPAVLDGSVRKKDNSHSLRFITTLETTKEQRQAIDDMFQQEGWLLFASTDEKEVEIPKDEAPKRDEKSPGQRLMSVLYVFYQQQANKEKYPTFDIFYRKTMEEQIEAIKSKLT